MANFPTLSTGAVAQYPAERARRFATQVCRFVDGSEQRFPNFGAPLLGWVIRLDELSETELVRLEQFFLSEQGQAGGFSFTDPWDGSVHGNCSFAEGAMAAAFRGVGRGAAQVTIQENR